MLQVRQVVTHAMGGALLPEGQLANGEVCSVGGRAVDERKQATVLHCAQVIAQALGGRVMRIVEVQEEGFQRPPQPVYQTEGFTAKRDTVATPIEVGSLDITSRVQLVAEVETNL